MPPRRRRRRQNTAFAEFLDDAVETAVDAFVDRAADAVHGWRERAVQQQMQQLPPEYLSGTFQCAGCKKEFGIEQMEQVHPDNGWGTCKGCYSFMFKAGIEKAKAFARRAAKNGAHRAANAAGAGFQPPPPPAGPPPWEVLGVAQHASVEDIKKAYRSKAMMYHPDRVGADAPAHEKQQARVMFQAVQQAYKVMMKVRSAPSE